MYLNNYLFNIRHNVIGGLIITIKYNITFTTVWYHISANVNYAIGFMSNFYIHISNPFVHMYVGICISVYIKFLGILYTYVPVPFTIATATVMPLKIGIMVNITFKCFKFWNYEKHALNRLFSFNEYYHFNLDFL